MKLQYMAGGGKSGEEPVLSLKGLKTYITQEYEIFVFYAHFVTALMLEYTEGNPFAQGLHDGTTL